MSAAGMIFRPLAESLGQRGRRLLRAPCVADVDRIKMANTGASTEHLSQSLRPLLALLGQRRVLDVDPSFLFGMTGENDHCGRSGAVYEQGR